MIIFRKEDHSPTIERDDIGTFVVVGMDGTCPRLSRERNNASKSTEYMTRVLLVPLGYERVFFGYVDDHLDLWMGHSEHISQVAAISEC